MIFKPSLLVLLAGAAALAALSNSVGAARSAEGAQQTRLGAAIQDDLNQRDQQAAQRGRQLDVREQAMRATEQRMRSTPPQTPTPAPDAGGPTASGKPTEEDQYAELAQIYQAMKPNRAAVVFEQLSMDVQVRVAKRMRERSVALIMANMAPPKAAALTMAIARRALPIPTPEGPSGIPNGKTVAAK